MRFLTSSVAAGMLCIAAPAWAQSLGNGDPLQFNHEYPCGGERIVVGHCRDQDPASYCLVYYPDRPLQGGSMVQKAEQLGAVLAKLGACASSSTGTSEAEAGQTAGSAPGIGTAGSQVLPPGSGGPPGLGAATWHGVDYTDSMSEWFTVAGISRTGNSVEGWFTDVYQEPQTVGGIPHVKFTQILYRGDCATAGLKIVKAVAFDSNHKVVADGPVPDRPFEKVEPDSLGGEQLAAMCGSLANLPAERTATGDAEHLWGVMRMMLAMQQQDGPKGKKAKSH